MLTFLHMPAFLLWVLQTCSVLFIPALQFFPQQIFFHLSTSRVRNPVNQLQALWPEPLRHFLLFQIGKYLTERQFLIPGQRHRKGTYPLSQTVIRHSDDGMVSHTRTALQCIVDLVGIQVFPAPDDHILFSSDNADIALRVHNTEITAVKPAIVIQNTIRNIPGL